MRKLLCWLAHDWSQWSAPQRVTNIFTYNPESYCAKSYVRTLLVQGRSCYRCGRVQERTVRKLGEARQWTDPPVEAPQ